MPENYFVKVLVQIVWAKVLRLRGKRLIPIFFFLVFICSKSFAYVEKYPPYNVKDGPPDHLEEKPPVDNDNSAYTSKDGKVSVRLGKTENGAELVIAESNDVTVNKDLKNLSSGDKSVKNDAPGNIEARDKLSEKSLKTKETENILEVDDKEINELSVIKDKLLQAIRALKEKDLQFKIGLEAKDRELKESLTAKDREHKKALEAKDKELVELLARKDKTLKVLQEKELDLESRLKARESEFEEALTAREKELEEARTALKSIAERVTGIKPRVEASDVAVENEQESSELRSDENMSFKIGVVNVQRVIEESKKGIEARNYFEGLISLRSEEELVRTQDELLEQIVQDIEYIIREYAEKEKFTYVTERLEGGVVFSEERFDITDEIIRLYDQKVGTSKP